MGIYCENIGMEYGIEKYVMLIMRSRKRIMTEVIELPSPRKVRTLVEKATYKYMGILEAVIIKEVEKKINKNTSGERENYSKPNNIAEISLNR